MKNLNLLLAGLVFGLFLVATPAFAVAIDDSITPQNCDRSNPACAQFVDTTSTGQIKWGGFVAGGLRSLTNLFVDGKLGVGTLRPSTGEQVLKVDVEGAVGARYYCDENGNHCVAGNALGTGEVTNITNIINGGDSLWATSTINSVDIYSRNTGNVGIGTNNPTAKLQISSDGTNVYLGNSGNGIYAVTNKTDGLGITGHSLGSGETYGGRFIANKIGAFFKGGSIGLYATDKATDRSDGNKIPSKLLNISQSYAGYFDGRVNINGDLNINGKVTVNGQPIAESKECAVCISAYDMESNTWSTWKCSGANGAESEGTGFSGSKSIEKVKVKMQCN